MKKLINDPIRVVPEMLEGLIALNPGLALLHGENVVVRSDIHSWKERRQVALISGGGSGHEPAHAGYVGDGMLTAAVCGEVFTSPSVDAVLAAIRACATPAGVLLIVKNYTGDRLNFGLAAELARSEGIATDMMIVADDAARSSEVPPDQSRGIAGTVFVHKIAGASAAAGSDLKTVKAEAELAAGRLASMGIALSPCTIPAAGQPTFELGDDEVEFGLGIHGERGIRRATIAGADAVTDELIEKLAARLSLRSGDHVALLVNNLGATPLMELAIVARRAFQILAARGVTVARSCCGTYLTALEMSGCSLSLMKTSPELLARFDAPTNASSWSATIPTMPGRSREIEVPLPEAKPAQEKGRDPGRSVVGASFDAALERIAQSLLDAEAKLTSLDQAVGDGDLGLSMSRAGRAILENRAALQSAGPAEALRLLASSVRRVVGGSSGPFYGVALLRAAASVEENGASLAGWALALESACEAISSLGGAVQGDRTMLDALFPAAEALRASVLRKSSSLEAISSAAQAAEQGAQQTAELMPKRGRSAYLGARALGHPDPGAVAVAIWLRAIQSGLTGSLAK